LAVLDLNVGGQMIFPVADLIQTRGVPFIFMTGYGQGISPKRFQDRPALRKPFSSEALSIAINQLRAAPAR
ncbi:MAG: response regulator, partial [Bradyrhizobium sp.]|nr:response regulator [Bradyrhizobium sp.]